MRPALLSLALLVLASACAPPLTVAPSVRSRAYNHPAEAVLEAGRAELEAAGYAVEVAEAPAPEVYGGEVWHAGHLRSGYLPDSLCADAPCPRLAVRLDRLNPALTRVTVTATTTNDLFFGRPADREIGPEVYDAFFDALTARLGHQ